MKSIRIIPRLDIKGPNLVKGIHFEGLRVLGAPEDFAAYYYKNGADELMYVDVVASLYERNSLHDIIKRTAKKIFIPLTVSGGIRTIDDIRAALAAGADKVSLNTGALKNPEIIKKASRVFGSSTIVVTIEAIKQSDGKYLAYTDNGREYTGVEVLSWARDVEKLGAGEIVISSVDQEGTGTGYDIKLTEMISTAVNIPVIAHGGAGKLEDITDVIRNGCTDAVSIASILHYEFVENNKTRNKHMEEGNIEFLKGGKKFLKIKPVTINKIKNSLHQNKIFCRH